jgi:hypothetical protein
VRLFVEKRRVVAVVVAVVVVDPVRGTLGRHSHRVPAGSRVVSKDAGVKKKAEQLHLDRIGNHNNNKSVPNSMDRHPDGFLLDRRCRHFNIAAVPPPDECETAQSTSSIQKMKDPA